MKAIQVFGGHIESITFIITMLIKEKVRLNRDRDREEESQRGLQYRHICLL